MNSADNSPNQASSAGAARTDNRPAAAQTGVLNRPDPGLDKAKRVMARLAALQEAELARQRTEASQTRLKRSGTFGMPNVFHYWAYDRD